MSVRTAMRAAIVWTLVAVAACGKPPPPRTAGPPPTPPTDEAPAAAPPAPVACVEVPADAQRAGPFAVAHGYNDFTVYRGERPCASVIQSEQVGPIAFVRLDAMTGAEPPELEIETWLMHGDRLSHRYTWSGQRYVEVGEPEMIPGPDKH